MAGRISRHQNAAAGFTTLLLLLAVAASPQQALAAGSSKVACDYSNRLCQWNASYAFGGAVLGDLAFFHGGLYANDASTPVNGSHMEVMDLRTMSPYVIQVDSNPELNTTRYNHFLAVWKDQLLAVAGQVDDGNGRSNRVMNVLALDLNTRTWRVIKKFTVNGNAEFVFDAATVSGDFLLAAFQWIDPEDPKRRSLTLNLNTAEIDGNADLFKGVMMLDWPLVAIMSLTNDGSYPHMALQARRSMPAGDKEALYWYAIDDKTAKGPLPFSVSAKLPRQPGGTGGQVLTLNIFQIGGKPKLVLLASTTAVFGSSTLEVTVVQVFDVSVKGTSSVSLQLTHILLTPPLGYQLSGLRSADLPLVGSVNLSAASVTALPYVGRLGLIHSIDRGNGNIQQAPGGFVIKGSGIADQSCQPGATWQPFVIKATFPQARPPDVVAMSNYTWCETRLQQLNASEIVSNSVDTKSNTKVFRVASSEGVQLMLLNPQVSASPGGSYRFVNDTVPLQGAFINLNRSSVTSFDIQPPKGYLFPEGLASCMGAIQGTSMYVEAGGSRYTDANQDVMSPGLYVMDMAVSAQQHTLLEASGGKAVPARTQSALACAPDGRIFLFGGLFPASRVAGAGGVTETNWQPTNSLYTFKLGGSVSRPSVTQQGEVTKGSSSHPLPAARSGHAMAYLAPGVVSGLGMRAGALVMYGGSNMTATNMERFADTSNETELAAKLAGTSWDTSTWLYDLGAGQWVRLDTEGPAPPGLMYASMEAYGEQVVLFGGTSFNASGPRVRLSTMMYILDFSSRPPFWRAAQISLNNQGAYQLDWPNTGVAMLPEFGAVALKHKSGVNLAPIPQSLDFTGDGAAIMSRWGLNTLNTTAGDWLRLAPSQQRLTLQQPLLLAADVILTGVAPSSSNKAGAGRHLLQQGGRLDLVCAAAKGKQENQSALRVRSGGAQLSNLAISGCNGKAVDVDVDATGTYTSPAVLTKITISANKGIQGAALYVGPAAAATLQGVAISSNTGPGGVVYAGARSSLTLTNCSITANNGSAVVFAGSSLTISGTNFTNNAAAAAVTAPEAVWERNGSAGGALRLLCYEPGPGGYDNVAVISNSSFRDNQGINGGALYAGPGTNVRLVSVLISGNKAYDGGGVFADRDACLQSMVNTTFTSNTALQSGGALKVHNPPCDMSWEGGRFSTNVAADGGAMYLTEVTTRNIIGSADYDNNKATRPPASRQTGPSSGGSGGAIYLGLWGSQVLLYNSTFINNTATRFGGAVHALAIAQSSVTLDRVNASHNRATLDAPDAAVQQQIEATLRSEGGALHVDGSVASATITDSTMENNYAGRGGAVSMNSAQGSLSVSRSTFASNIAFTAGGALAVTERKSVNITNSTFSNNLLFWSDLAAGGGFYCLLCNAVNITSSRFDGNRAAYGGGVALLQPWQASVIFNTSFVRNAALQDPWGSAGQASNRRRVLLAVEGHSLFSGSLAAVPQGARSQAAAVEILGPIAANVTGDSGQYTGGGGLYVSLSNGVRLEQCVFLGNSGYNGGGFLARTDACRSTTNTNTPATCQLRLSQISVRNNTADAAGGALITNIRPEVVQLEGCSAGTFLTRDTLSCLEAPNTLLKQVASSGESSASGRSLLQTGGDAVVPLGVGGANAARSGNGNLLLTAAASVKCLLRVSAGDASDSTWLDDDCAAPISAPPGAAFGRSFVLMDGLGDPIVSGIWDASMPMGASLNRHNDSVPYRILGNTTVAQNGTAAFTGLVVNGKPGDTVTLVFRTQNGLNISRQVILRRCIPGEITDNSTSSTTEASYTCRKCPSPTYSFYPTATSCSQCALLPSGSYDVCNEAAVVPAAGWYQSHPRSPVLTPCISSLACSRSTETIQTMSKWAQAAADTPTVNMTDAQVNAYMEYMCAEGHTGPVCGACLPKYGHSGSGHTCVKCLPRGANNFAYFLVCCFMMLVPAIQMVMHAKGVMKSTELVEEASRLSATSTAAGTPPNPAFLPKALQSATGAGAYMPVLQPVHETGPGSGSASFVCPSAAAAAGAVPTYVSPSAAAAAAAAAGGAGGEFVSNNSMGKDVGAIELAPMQQSAAADGSGSGRAVGKSDVDSFKADQGIGGGYDMVSPFSDSSAVAGAMAVSRDESAMSAAASTLSGGHPSQALGFAASGSGLKSSQSKSARLLQRLFDTASVDHEDATWGVSHISTQHRALHHAPSSMNRRGPSGTSTTSAGSAPSYSQPPAAPAENPAVPAGSEGQQQPDSFAGQIPSSAAALGGGGLMLSHGGKSIAARQSVHRRMYKFWHADIISMLVNYMQLLGLLRLVRINWVEQLTKILTYLDFTSGATTWVSVECSLSPDGTVPRSVMRSIIVLLWPLIALVCLGIFWSIAAFMLRHRPWARRPQYFRRWLTQHVVMCVVVLLYFLYTTTTREIVSLFSCQQVDNPSQLPAQAKVDEETYLGALQTLTYRWPSGYWTSDTLVPCGSPTHIALVAALGIPGVLFFALGLPVGLWVYLARINKQKVDGRNRLEDPEVELQFGAVYEKYRYSCYYWECVILLEAFTLTLLLVLLMTQNNAALQVLVAMAVIFVEAVLHITFQPYACRLLDTLRRLAVYGLMSTLFLLMLVTLAEQDSHDQLLTACMIIVAFINIGVIGVHIWACGSEVRRWLLWTVGKGPGDTLTWGDITKAMVPEGFWEQQGWWSGGCLKQPRGRQRNLPASAAAGVQGEGKGAGVGKSDAPVELSGSPSFRHQAAAAESSDVVLGPAEQGPGREGVVLVINPSPPEPPTPSPGWLGKM